MAARLVATLRQVLRRLDGRTAGDDTDAQLLDRFTGAGDETAFANLMHRHGPMVFGVCRRVLGAEQDAEDAFQAVFLVLARKADSVDRRRSLGNWLYTVAHNLAVNAKIAAARRRTHTRRALEVSAMQASSAATPQQEMLGREAQSVLDAELSRLPEKYRAPLVLCYLQGKTKEAAARELGFPGGSMSRRLERGRELLRHRLTSRGISLTGVGLTALLIDTATGAVPARLFEPLARAACLASAGQSLGAGCASAQAVALADGALRTMAVKGWKTAAAVLLVLGVIGTGAGIASRQPPVPVAVAGPAAVTETPTPEAGAATNEKLARDLFGRPQPWGPEVQGARLCMHLPRTRLLFGEPIEFRALTVNARPDGPFVRFSLPTSEKKADTRVEITTAAGEPVPFTLQCLAESWSIDGSSHVGRLWAQDKFARGRYLVPGKYLLHLSFTAKWDAADPKAWVGSLTSQRIGFEVLENGPAARQALVPEPLRLRVAALLRDLDSDVFARREAAEEELMTVAVDALPLLEEALQSPSPEVASRSRRIIEKAVLGKMFARVAYAPVWHEGGPLLAYLGEPTWKLVRERAQATDRGSFPDPQALRLQATAYGPITAVADPARLSPEDGRQLAARLRDPEPLVRLQTIRSLSATTDPTILSALVERLADPASYMTFGHVCMASPHRLLAFEAQEALVRQGKVAIAPLIGFGRSKDAQKYHRQIAATLGEIGFDPQSLQYLEELLASSEREDRLGAIEGLVKVGPPAVPALLKAAQNATEDPILRREAFDALGKIGSAQELTALVMTMLRDRQWLNWAAVAARKHGVKESLPMLVAIARDETIDQNIRYSAVTTVYELAEYRESETLLLGLLDRKVHGGVRGQAMGFLARMNCRAAVPLLLDALDESDWYVRASADTSLRAYARKADGVGYDSYQPDSSKWREWWKQHQ